MSSPHEQLFLTHLPLLDAVVRLVAHRYRLSADEREELGAQVRLRMIEQDYLVLRRFEGRSSIRTYLTTVVTRLFLDERVKAWGKWRPSAVARRLGPQAVQLERLLTRDGLSIDEAVRVLSTGRDDVSVHELRTLAEQLPPRMSRREVTDDALEDMPTEEPDAERLAQRQDVQTTRRRLRDALSGAVTSLSPRERLLLRLRFEEGVTVAQLSRQLDEPQKPLYRTLERLLRTLRAHIVASGVSEADVSELFEGFSLVETWSDVSAPPGGTSDRAAVSIRRAHGSWDGGDAR